MDTDQLIIANRTHPCWKSVFICFHLCSSVFLQFAEKNASGCGSAAGLFAIKKNK